MSHSVRIKDIVNLAAPSSWPASVMPAILAVGISVGRVDALPLDLTACLFLVAVLMQSAVNAFNDYADFVKGTDTLENSPDASDAVIVYGMSPKAARNCGIVFLALAFAFTPYVVMRVGFTPIIIGLIGAAVVVTYSFGKLPISYLPLGELVSGLVMGGLITLAGVCMLTGALDLFVLVQALPIIMAIALIMLSNNGCDIERDLKAGRRTLPCLIGRGRMGAFYRVALVVWALLPVVLFALQGKTTSLVVYLLEFLVLVNAFSRQLGLELGQKMRMQVMAGIGTLNIMLGFAYIVALVVGA